MDQCVVGSQVPTTGYLAHVSWLGIQLATLWFAVQHSIHWATPAKAKFDIFLFYASPSFNTRSVAFIKTCPKISSQPYLGTTASHPSISEQSFLVVVFCLGLLEGWGWMTWSLHSLIIQTWHPDYTSGLLTPLSNLDTAAWGGFSWAGRAPRMTHP